MKEFKKTTTKLIVFAIISIITILIPINVNAKEGTISSPFEGITGAVTQIPSAITKSQETQSQAEESSGTFFESVKGRADDFVNTGSQDDINSKSIIQMLANIFEVFITAGMIAAVIIIAVLGIRFLLASAEGKADIKEKMTPYVIGCIVTFGAYAIWRVAISILAPLG